MTQQFPFDEPLSFDPVPRLVEMQAVDPVPWVRIPTGHDVRLATRYDDVRRALSDSMMSREACVAPGAPTLVPGAMSPDILSNMDPPRHTRLRRLVSKAFTARTVERFRPRAELVVDELLDDMVIKGAPADLVACLANPLPAVVICELLGIPAGEREPLYAWLHAAVNQHGDDELDQLTGHAAGYLLDLIGRKRQDPGDDLLTALVEVSDQGDRLTEPELLMTMLSLFGAGQETTSSQLTKSVYVLLSRYPEQWDRLVADPGLVSQAVEELLRFVGLGHAAFPRVATTDTTFSGVAVPSGSVIFPVLNVANRDPAVFPDPNRLDITRADAGLHLSFGRGIHFCLGAPLARLELCTALRALVTMFPTLRLAEQDQEPDWDTQTVSCGLKTLPVTW
ncbi:cytochrome P450 [Kibdelosporangium banguiense]|uniref:Cytochrome P450 n=1 Tax=Kibdelosporangium banguiense TaxID=1365924 RepID=A0ABS4TP99_9PSEU|nr:cytochrome P450 [Kibdelosporangium banguiense]MBP2325721.1 cytochrome P450 [Kibdelosporangium banguiense]